MQKAKYEQEKKSLPAEDLRAVDADEKASRIAAKIRKVSLIEMKRKTANRTFIFLPCLDRSRNAAETTTFSVRNISIDTRSWRG